MLAQKYRIRKKKDIERIFKKGRNIKQDSLILKTASNDLGFYRFGFIVSQKVSKKAVQRNKIKRKLREIVQQRVNFNAAGRDNLFIALPQIEIKNIELIVKALLKRAKIIQNRI